MFEPPQVSLPVQREKGCIAKDSCLLKTGRSGKGPSQPLPVRTAQWPNKHGGDQTRRGCFSKYSEAAELRSFQPRSLATQESDVMVGPFKLRSRKQRTLSMIEEIRAAQEREEELKRRDKSCRVPRAPRQRTPPSLPSRRRATKLLQVEQVCADQIQLLQKLVVLIQLTIVLCGATSVRGYLSVRGGHWSGDPSVQRHTMGMSECFLEDP